MLLLELPARAFKAIVPALIVLALLLVVFGRRLTAWLATRGHHATARVTGPLWLTVLGTGVYGGYFGAAQGVLLMGFLGVYLDESLQRQNALKNVLAGFVNLVAAIVFVVDDADRLDGRCADRGRLDRRAACSARGSAGACRRPCCGAIIVVVGVAAHRRTAR